MVRAGQLQPPVLNLTWCTFWTTEATGRKCPTVIVGTIMSSASVLRLRAWEAWMLTDPDLLQLPPPAAPALTAAPQHPARSVEAAAAEARQQAAAWRRDSSETLHAGCRRLHATAADARCCEVMACDHLSRLARMFMMASIGYAHIVQMAGIERVIARAVCARVALLEAA